MGAAQPAVLVALMRLVALIQELMQEQRLGRAVNTSSSLKCWSHGGRPGQVSMSHREGRGQCVRDATGVAPSGRICGSMATIPACVCHLLKGDALKWTIYESAGRTGRVHLQRQALGDEKPSGE
jgi:hypothetical protein